ncbi:hypothetical protein BMS3Abin15_00530 [bacterium BMS3Abin15]|nr:hypothetical protein BMS3Abin15_00530 [bacterium BMS3Abin15]HDZ85064.1 hypothetical protein [Candidatus Moranbacteria bacterium]
MISRIFVTKGLFRSNEDVDENVAILWTWKPLTLGKYLTYLYIYSWQIAEELSKEYNWAIVEDKNVKKAHCMVVTEKAEEIIKKISNDATRVFHVTENGNPIEITEAAKATMN